MIVHNVINRLKNWIGPWEIDPVALDPAKLDETDRGRFVVYRDGRRAELGTLSSWTLSAHWARFDHGSTGALCPVGRLYFALRDASPDFYRLPIGG